MISCHLLSPGIISCHLWVGSGQVDNRSSCVTGPRTEAKEHRPLSIPPSPAPPSRTPNGSRRQNLSQEK